jgi:hypothetical protein
MEIVLVYLGKKKLPRYVIENIKYLKRTFPKTLITLISDNSKNLAKVKDLGANIFHCSDFYSIAPKEYLEKAPDLKFRGGFWFLTFARFFALNEYCAKFNRSNIIHLESDVLLMENFPFDKFSNINGLAFPLVNQGYAAASILFIKDHSAISTLCDFTKERISANPELTDMYILGSRDLAQRVEVTYLPTAFGGANHFQNWVRQIDRESLCLGISEFGGIFDGISWGQYLTGEDPRNHYGIRKLYRNQTAHSVAINLFKIFFSNNQLYASSESEIYKIYSLHIHSKDKRMFTSEDDYAFLKDRVLNSEKGEKSEIVWVIAIKFFPLRVKNASKKFVRSAFKKSKN